MALNFELTAKAEDKTLTLDELRAFVEEATRLEVPGDSTIMGWTYRLTQKLSKVQIAPPRDNK